MQLSEILQKLQSLSKPEAAENMARYGINPETALGISIPELRKLAKQIGKNHPLALELWSSDIHEARILACYVALPKAVSENLMEEWVREFNSWDLCDQCCCNLFDRTIYAYPKALEWSSREEEFVKRAAFTLMACLAVHDKKASDDKFRKFQPIIEREATDPRNFVKKAVNWALRQIGKRNRNLNEVAIRTAEKILTLENKSAQWIARDALRELTSEKIQQKLK
jgi:3-methyladenine DNA glycosylase AlkD